MEKRLLSKTLCALLILLTGIITSMMAQPGRQIFDDSYVHKIEIEFPFPAWRDTLKENIQKSFKVESHVYSLANITIDGTLIDSVGVRYKGAASLSGINENKGPLKIDFNEFVKKKKYDGVKKFNLHNFRSDPSHLREKLAYDLLRDLGLNSVRVAYTEVWVNGDFRGLFNIVEQVDKTYLENNHGTKKGNLYKGDHGARFQLNREIPFEEDIYTWEKKTNEDENDWSDLYNFEEVFAKDPAGKNYKAEIEAIYDLDKAMKILAFNRISQTSDALFATHGNFFLYNNPNTNKLEWIPWDYNQTFSQPRDETRDPIESYNIFLNEHIGINGTRRPFGNAYHSQLLGNSGIKDLFIEKACQIIALFDEDRLNKKIDNLVSLVRPHVITDPYLRYGYDAFEKNINENFLLDASRSTKYFYPGIKKFFRDQNKRVKQQFLDLGITCDEYTSPTGLTAPNNLTLELDGKGRLNVFITPSNSYVEGLQWYSEDPSIVEVEQTGDVEAKSEGSTFIVVSTTDGAISKRIAVNVNASPSTLSVNENVLLIKDKISVYPNPVSDVINVNLGKNYSSVSVKIYNSLGSMLLKQSVSGIDKLTLNLESITDSGLYFIEIDNGTNSKIVKFIKN